MLYADHGGSSPFASVTSYSTAVSSQAVAAGWAAFCSHATGQEHLEVDFLNLQLFFTMQYGLDQTNKPDWQLQHPTRPAYTAMESACMNLVDCNATEHYVKPSGWSTSSWAIMLNHCKAFVARRVPAQEYQLQIKEAAPLERARAWQQEYLKPVLARCRSV